MSSSSMPATHGHNAACCNVPPVVSDGYRPKGSYVQAGGKKTYVTGPSDATKGLVSIFDIFGFFSQTLQGADILATGGANQQYKVFMPDWFDGKPCPLEWYPPDTEEKQAKLDEWFGKNSPFDVAAALPGYVKALQEANPSINSWGIVGYCWGGKVIELVTSQASSNPFSIAVACHPAMVNPSGADNIGVPYGLIASMEEPVETIKDFESRLKVPHRVEIFGDQVHGFMAARADLNDGHVKAEYARTYQVVLDFLGKEWK
ncbi:Alpha/Beta hydrolase protein [Xylaria venustula]|nr:Alpha/Beta hydrolase protein [Xylaria venustula]